MLEINKVKKETDKIKFVLHGELDMASGEGLEEELKSEDLSEVRTIYFDLSNLNFIDSTGIGQLIKYYRHYSKQNIAVKIVNDNSEIEEILELIGVREIMN